MADYAQMVQDLMQVLSTGESLRPDQPYTSRDPGTKYRGGEVTSDVGLLDPVDLLAGMLASKGASLAGRLHTARSPRARMLRDYTPPPYDPSRPLEVPPDLVGDPETEQLVAVLKRMMGELDEGRANLVRRAQPDIPPTDIPGGRSTIPKGPEIDLSPDPLPAPDPMERWLADKLRNPTPEAREAIDWYLRGQRAGGYGGFAEPRAPRSPTPLSEIPLEELMPRHPGQGDDQLLLAEMLEDYGRVLRGEPSKTLPQAPGVEPPDRLEALDILREHIDRILADMDIPGGGMHRPGASEGLP